MADSRDNQHNQENQYGKDHHWTREDFAACASANANYYYQMSLWWWNTYMHNLHAGAHPWTSQFTDQGCECVERSLNERTIANAARMTMEALSRTDSKLIYA